MNASFGGLLRSPGITAAPGSDTLEQSVKIEASFPSVTNHSEIEEAFTTLINQAS
jgi:hypothetical protein